MDAGAALRSVENEAGGGLGVVGDLRAGVSVKREVAFACGDDREAARGEQGPQAHTEGERYGLFGDRRADLAAVVVPAMRGIEQYDEARLWTGWRGRRGWRRRCLGCRSRRRRGSLRECRRNPQSGEQEEPQRCTDPICGPEAPCVRRAFWGGHQAEAAGAAAAAGRQPGIGRRQRAESGYGRRGSGVVPSMNRG